jgi:hypothetical protein
MPQRWLNEPLSYIANLGREEQRGKGAKEQRDEGIKGAVQVKTKGSDGRTSKVERPKLS